MTEGTRLIRISIELAETFGSRTEDGDRLTFDWGEPTEEVINDQGQREPIYTPTVTRHREEKK